LNIFTQLQEIYDDFPSSWKIKIILDGIEETSFKFTPQSSSDMLVELQNLYPPSETFVHLLTGEQLEGNVIGIASLKSACYNGRGVTHSHEKDAITAKTLAHELGHNLGIYHTNTWRQGAVIGSLDKTCKESQAVMSYMLMGTQALWESCSPEWFHEFLDGYPYGCKRGECQVYPGLAPGCMKGGEGVSICGDGRKEDGEECDVLDACCINCKMVGQCLAKDPCCTDECQFKKKGTLCREKKDTWCSEDTECTGKSSDCPPDTRKNFLGCLKYNFYGTCYMGECLGRDIQCKEINPSYGYRIEHSCGSWEDCDDLKCFIGLTQRCDTPYAPERLKLKDGSLCQMEVNGEAGVCMKGKCSVTPKRDFFNKKKQRRKKKQQ
jgi:hypothetical protein